MAKHAGRWLMAGGLAAAIGVATAPALAQDPFAGIPNLQFRYYDVRGTNSDEINASMHRRGPDNGEGDGAGSTDYRIAWSWGRKRIGSRCEVIDPEVRFSAIVLLPRLVDEERQSEEVRLGWRKLIAQLRAHEAGHARIAYEHADEVRAAVAAAPCGKEAAWGQRALNRIRQLQADYDRRTVHGLVQGAIER